MVATVTLNTPYDQFCKEQAWTHMADTKTMTALMGRFDRGTQLFRNDKVTWNMVKETGSSRTYGLHLVGSATDTQKTYQVDMYGCDCPDGSTTGKAPWGWCKHRLATWLYDRQLRHMMSAITSGKAMGPHHITAEAHS